MIRLVDLPEKLDGWTDRLASLIVQLGRPRPLTSVIVQDRLADLMHEMEGWRHALAEEIEQCQRLAADSLHRRFHLPEGQSVG